MCLCVYIFIVTYFDVLFFNLSLLLLIIIFDLITLRNRSSATILFLTFHYCHYYFQWLQFIVIINYRTVSYFIHYYSLQPTLHCTDFILHMIFILPARHYNTIYFILWILLYGWTHFTTALLLQRLFIMNDLLLRAQLIIKIWLFERDILQIEFIL